MIVRSVKELDYVMEQLDRSNIYCIDTETVDRGFPDISLTGVALGWSTESGAYIPINHKEGTQLPEEEVVGRLKRFIEGSRNKLAIMHNAKYDMSVLHVNGGIKFPPNIFDTMVASWLIDTENEHGLKPLAKRYLDHEMVELTDIAPRERHPVTNDWVYRTDLVDIETLGGYAVDDVVQPIRLMYYFLPLLERDGLMKVFCELEMPKVFILNEMEMRGVKLDTEELSKHLAEAPSRIEKVEKKMFSLRPSKKPFNANSPKQLNEVLFDEIGIKPIGEKGKSGLYSTSRENMDKWAGEHAIVEAILEYRNLTRLMGTYLKGLSKRVGKDGRIRTRYNQILTTGRLSSSSPNLQNIPRPDKDVFGLRGLFVAEEGWKLVVADYSQIELRVLAHISRDPVFIESFKEGVDLHSYAAKVLFDLEESVEEVKKYHPEYRNVGKTFNFATVYEAGIRTLATQAKVSEARAKDLRARYFSQFRGIRDYIEAMHNKAEQLGYVTTITGRRRHLADAQLKGRSSRENALKSSAFRQSSNSPVQGSAADVLFIAMRNIYNRLEEEGLSEKARIVLQVHDELLVECKEDIVDYIAKLVKEEMENAVELRVPLIADVGIGDRWSDV